MKAYNLIFKYIAALTFVLTSVTVLAGPEDYNYQFESAELQERYKKLTYELRCPKCQNQNVADSNAPIALDIRAKVYELLNLGKTDKEIVDYMVERYTEFVTYKTRLSWFTVWLYILPAILLLVGLLGLYLRTRKTKETVSLSQEQQDEIDQLLSR